MTTGYLAMIAACLLTAACGAEDKGPAPAAQSSPSIEPQTETLRAALDGIGQTDGSIEIALSEGSFAVEPDTYFCRHAPLVANTPFFAGFEDIGVAGIEDALYAIGQSPMYDTATRVVPGNHPQCASADAIHNRTALGLNDEGRPFLLAIVFWQGEEAKVVAVRGDDIDPDDPNSWGNLPYRKGGPRFEDVLFPALQEITDRTLAEVLSSDDFD